MHKLSDLIRGSPLEPGIINGSGLQVSSPIIPPTPSAWVPSIRMRKVLLAFDDSPLKDILVRTLASTLGRSSITATPAAAAGFNILQNLLSSCDTTKWMPIIHVNWLGMCFIKVPEIWSNINGKWILLLFLASCGAWNFKIFKREAIHIFVTTKWKE